MLALYMQQECCGNPVCIDTGINIGGRYVRTEGCSTAVPIRSVYTVYPGIYST